jgi:hypothetical protein
MLKKPQKGKNNSMASRSHMSRGDGHREIDFDIGFKKMMASLSVADLTIEHILDSAQKVIREKYLNS